MRVNTAILAVVVAFGTTGVASAGQSNWMTESQAHSYAKANLGPGAAAHPTAIRCRVSGGQVQVRFTTATGEKPFDKWWFVIAKDPKTKLKRGYKVVSGEPAGNVRCALAYKR